MMNSLNVLSCETRCLVFSEECLTDRVLNEIVSMTTHGAFDNEDTRKEKCRNALDGLFELNVHDMMPRVNDIIFQEMIDH